MPSTIAYFRPNLCIPERGDRNVNPQRVIGFVLLTAAILLCHPRSTAAADDGIVFRLDDIKITEIPLSEDSLRAVLEEYAKIVRDLDRKTEDTGIFQERTGAVFDYEGDGYPELVLLYKVPDSYWDIEATIVCHTGEGLLSRYRQRFSLNDYSDYFIHSAIFLSYSEEEPLFHFTYYSYSRGVDAVIAVSDRELTLLHTLLWQEDPIRQQGDYYVDGVENQAKFTEIYEKIEMLVCAYDDSSFPTLQELQYQILHYKS